MMPPHYVVQAATLPSGKLPERARIFLRPDGYFILAPIFKKLLESWAETIPGANASVARAISSGAKHP